MPEGLTITLEGRTRLAVPSASLTAAAPATSPVFYNPAAGTNRDVSVAVAEGAGGGSFCDAMAGVGARGVRIAVEARSVRQVTLVDFNRAALRVATRSARLNRVSGKCKVVESESAAFLVSRFGRDERYDFVDVDPFGTPARYLQGAVSATSDGGLVSLTATDTAALCGVYPKVCLRRYGARPMNNHFSHETGIRVLLMALARAAASQDAGISPVVSHSTKHYIRVYARIERGASRADASLSSAGFVASCSSCGWTWLEEGVPRECPTCGARASCAGPLWARGLTDNTVLRKSLRAARKLGLASASKTLGPLTDVDHFPPWSFRVDDACSALGAATVPKWRVVALLEARGFRCGDQPFEKDGVKTDATYDEFSSAVKESLASASLSQK